jgi:hypothetical protein
MVQRIAKWRDGQKNSDGNVTLSLPWWTVNKVLMTGKNIFDNSGVVLQQRRVFFTTSIVYWCAKPDSILGTQDIAHRSTVADSILRTQNMLVSSLRILRDRQRVLFSWSDACRTVFLQRMKVRNAGSLPVCLNRHAITKTMLCIHAVRILK